MQVESTQVGQVGEGPEGLGASAWTPVPARHPVWCDRGYCETDCPDCPHGADCPDGGDVWHRSAPVRVRVRDALLTVSWVRVDKRGLDGPGRYAQGETELWVEVAKEGHEMRLVLLLREAHRLAGLLTAQSC